LVGWFDVQNEPEPVYIAMYRMLLVASLLLVEGTVQAQDASDLARIRRALTTPSLLRPQPPEPTFRIVVDATSFQGQRPSDAPLPPPPGGLYAFELRQQLGNPWKGEPLIKVDVLPLADRLFSAIGRARRRDAQSDTQDDIRRVLAEFCSVNVCADATRR
jgi:hypothetical protein